MKNKILPLLAISVLSLTSCSIFNSLISTSEEVGVYNLDKMQSGDDIEKALINLILQGYNIDIENYENKEDLINSIIKANINLKESTSSSDYERIGKDINKLQSLIDKLENLEKIEEEEQNKQKDKIKELPKSDSNTKNEISNSLPESV